MSVRLVIDASLCDGHGICALRCPELISLDEWGYAHVAMTRVDSERLATRARRAAAACPVGALRVDPER
jgi:ferredoxin